jgi:hypothetical protein
VLIRISAPNIPVVRRGGCEGTENGDYLDYNFSTPVPLTAELLLVSGATGLSSVSGQQPQVTVTDLSGNATPKTMTPTPSGSGLKWTIQFTIGGGQLFETAGALHRMEITAWGSESRKPPARVKLLEGANTFTVYYLVPADTTTTTSTTTTTTTTTTAAPTTVVARPVKARANVP